MRKIKVAQFGVTHEHAEGKMKSMLLHPDVFEIVGVVDDRDSAMARGLIYEKAKIEKRMATYDGIPRLTEDELFAIRDLDAVVVETTNLDLMRSAQRCLAHKLPIHMDKPGGEDLAAFVQLRREYEKCRLPFQMAYMFRGNPAMQWIKNAAARGWLGEIFEVQAGMSHSYGDDAYHEYIATFRGGIMFNLGGHLIDFVVPLLGRPEKVIPILKTLPGDSTGVLNNGVAILEYPRATVTLRANSREIGADSRRRLKVCGTKGTVELCPIERFDNKPLKMELILREGNPEYEAGVHTLDFGITHDRYEGQLLDFASDIRGETKTGDVYDSRHDCLVHEILLAASGYFLNF